MFEGDSVGCGHCGTECVEGQVFGARKARFWASSRRRPRGGAYTEATVVRVAENLDQLRQTNVATSRARSPAARSGKSESTGGRSWRCTARQASTASLAQEDVLLAAIAPWSGDRVSLRRSGHSRQTQQISNFLGATSVAPSWGRTQTYRSVNLLTHRAPETSPSAPAVRRAPLRAPATTQPQRKHAAHPQGRSRWQDRLWLRAGRHHPLRPETS